MFLILKQERTPSAEHREKFCEFCQRELPKKKRKRRNRKFPRSPYECELCGASNHIDDAGGPNVSESEDEAIPAETVRDTIQRGNAEQVIDHRTFSEHEEMSENFSEKSNVDTENEESDIFWRSDSDFDGFHGNLEEQMSDMNLNDDGYAGTVFLTETAFGNHGNRPVEIKMAWDDDSSSQFAEISKTIATDDGIEAEDVTSQKIYDDIPQENQSNVSDNSDSNSENLRNVNLFPESDSRLRLSPTPPSHSRRGSSPRNFRYGGGHDRRNSSGEVHLTSLDSERDSNDMTESPIANRSVGLSRVALMRLSRQSRARTRGSRSSPGTPQPVVRRIEVCKGKKIGLCKVPVSIKSLSTLEKVS